MTVSCGNKVLVEYTVYEKQPEPIPEPAEPMKSPEEMKSTEELYLAGTHLEQYRHATFEPADYYLEGLKRDSTDIRLNNSYGLLLYKRGRIKDSIPYFRAAIKKQTWKNPNLNEPALNSSPDFTTCKSASLTFASLSLPSMRPQVRRVA